MRRTARCRLLPIKKELAAKGIVVACGAADYGGETDEQDENNELAQALVRATCAPKATPDHHGNRASSRRSTRRVSSRARRCARIRSGRNSRFPASDHGRSEWPSLVPIDRRYQGGGFERDRI